MRSEMDYKEALKEIVKILFGTEFDPDRAVEWGGEILDRVGEVLVKLHDKEMIITLLKSIQEARDIDDFATSTGLAITIEYLQSEK